MLTRVLAVTLSLTLAAPTVTIAQAPANCSNIADQFDRETRAFTAEADRQNLDFVKELALDKITGALKERMTEAVSGTMAGDIATHLSENWEAANTARDRLTRAREYFDEWLACFNAPLGTCDRAALNKRYQDEFKAYMDSLLDDAGQSEARQRVDRARGLLHNYLVRTMNISKGTMQAMAACTAPMTRQPRVDPADATTPAAPATPVVPAKGGGGPGMGTYLALMAGAIGGGVALGTLAGPEDEFGATTTTPTSTTTSPSQTTGVSTFNGTYRAQVTRSCVAGGFPASCQQQPESATCSPTNFTFTVTSGTIRDCGTFFSSATVQSNGSYSGLYLASAGGVPISGTFQTSGTFTLQGSTTYQGSSYTVRIQATRQ